MYIRVTFTNSWANPGLSSQTRDSLADTSWGLFFYVHGVTRAAAIVPHCFDFFVPATHSPTQTAELLAWSCMTQSPASLAKKCARDRLRSWCNVEEKKKKIIKVQIKQWQRQAVEMRQFAPNPRGNSDSLEQNKWIFSSQKVAGLYARC